MDVHVELPIGPILDEFCRRAVQQAQLLEPLGNHTNRRIVRIVPVVSLDGLLDRSQLRLEDNFVNGTLFRTESTVNWKRSGHVRCVVVEFATGIDQKQVTILEHITVFDIVQSAGVGPATDNRTV